MRRRRKNFIIILGLLLSSILTIAQNEAYLWQGYKHQWTYNHRINRIGNYIDHQQNELVYTSASGFGADSCYYTSGYTYLKSEYLNFQTDKVHFNLLGKEGELLVAEKEVTLPLPTTSENLNYYTVLNGFDLLAKGKADKLVQLNLKIGDVSQSNNQIKFKIYASLVASCKTLECNRFKQVVDYEIDLHYLLLSGEPTYIKAQNQSFSKDYHWDKKEELQTKIETIEVKGNNSNTYDSAALGLKSFSINMDAEHWIMEWANRVELLAYDTSKGTFKLTLDYYLKEWAENMRKESAYPKVSKFALKSKGRASLNIQVALFEFKDTKVVQHQETGALFWRGKNLSALDEKAIDRKTLLKNP